MPLMHSGAYYQVQQVELTCHPAAVESHWQNEILQPTAADARMQPSSACDARPAMSRLCPSVHSCVQCTGLERCGSSAVVKQPDWPCSAPEQFRPVKQTGLLRGWAQL